MGRQTKVGMLVAFGVILLVGIIISDHLSAVRQAEPAGQMSGLAPIAAQSVTSQNPGTVRSMPIPLPGEFDQTETGSDVQGVNNFDGQQQPAAPAVTPRPGQIAGGPGSDVFVVRQVSTTPVLNNDVIGRPGIDLSSDLPAAAPERVHTVVKGDSLFSIAKKYYNDGSKHTVIASANKLTGKATLKLGMKLTIPNLDAKLGAQTQQTAQATQGAQAAPAVQEQEQSQKFMQYTVKPGDMLSTIAGKTLGSSKKWQVILDANKDTLKKPTDLKPGMVLKIPRGNAV